MFLQPGHVGATGGGGHGLLDELDVPVRVKPLDVAQRLFLRRPRFVRIHAHRLGRRGLAERGEVRLVIRAADLEFQHGVMAGLTHLLADDVRRIDADAEAGDVLALGEAQLEMIVDRNLRRLRRAIEQGDVDAALGRVVPGGDGVEILHAAGDVVEREPAGIDLPQERFDHFHWLGVTRGGRCFADAAAALRIGEIHQHHAVDIRARSAEAAGDAPGARERQVNAAELKFHPGRVSAAGELRKT